MEKRTIRNSVNLRLIIIGLLTLILMIPVGMIMGLIHERKSNRDRVAGEISQSWGEEQTIAGPFLNIPFREMVRNESGVLTEEIRYIHLLPTTLQISGKVLPERRYRSIYEIIVYSGEFHLEGYFDPISVTDLDLSGKKLLWNQAYLSLGISDMKGIREFITVKVNGQEFQAEPGLRESDVISSGVVVNSTSFSDNRKIDFAIDLAVNGSFALHFVPVGKETMVELHSSWNSPSFRGNFLPIQREVSENGFSARWKVLHLNRNFPQIWIGPAFNVETSKFGVEFFIQADEYQQTFRAVKYAFMIIALTFLTFFLIELLGRKVLHPVQYLLIGLALLIFYTLLLSVSEYLLFRWAYLISALAITGLITFYTYNILGEVLRTMIVTGILIILYGYVYFVLQLADYALLVGSIGLFIVLTVVMVLTRKINWYDAMKKNHL